MSGSKEEAARKRGLIEVFQPVAAIPNDKWTDDLATCLEWFQAGKRLRILTRLPNLQKPAKETRRRRGEAKG